MSKVEYSILGPMTVRLAPDAAPIALGEKGRRLLGRLLLEPGTVVSIDALAEVLWGDEPRADPRNGVQVAIKALRKALGDEGPPWRIILNVGSGYRIVVDPLAVDAERFKLLAARGHHLAQLPHAARAMLAEALAAWSGALLAEHATEPWAAGHARELESVCDEAEVDLNETRLALGDHARLDGTLRRQILEHPLDERRRAQFIRALDGAHRAAEAGLAYREAIRALGTVGPDLRALGDRIGRGMAADRQPPASAAPTSPSRGLLLCALIEPRARRRDEPGIGTLSLLVDRRGGAPYPVGDDRLIATFEDPEDALRAARTIAEDIRLRSSIGLHAGAVVTLGSRLAGPGPARCWQLARAASPGQVLLSVEACRRISPPADLRDLGVQRFEDLAPGESVFALSAGRNEITPPQTLSRMAHNLPVQATRFVGRDAELARLAQRVAGGGLLTLTGTGGCGKTRLALQLAARSIARYDDGAWFVSLAALGGNAGAEDIATAVANQLGVRALPDETMSTAVVRHLSERVLLLVLDNCEHVHEACGALVTQLLRGCSDLFVVTTTRRPLRVDGERVVGVPPMSTQAAAEAGALPDAVELLLERAGPLPAGAASDADTPADALRICRALDGLPLAIELAAGQVATRGLAGVAVEVETMMKGERGLDHFVTLDPSRPARQRTIEAAIDWGHERLSPGQRGVLRRLAVFRGTFGVAEAQQLLAGDGDDPVAVVATLESLVECSMVAPAPPLQDAARRRLVEPIRAFALRKLELAGEAESAGAEHARVFAALASDTAPQLFGSGEQVSLVRLEGDHDNLRAALGWFVEHGNGHAALRLVGKLWWLWFSHGHLTEGSAWVRRTLALDGAPSRERVRALRAGSHLAWWQGDYARSHECNVELETCAAAIGDAWGLAWAPMGHGAVELFRDPHKALVMFEDSRRQFEALDCHWEAGYALQVIGGSLWFGGDDQAALTAFQEAVTIFERLGHRSVLASVQRSAGLMTARCGDPERGVALCRAALQTSMAIDDRAGSAQALNHLAAISRDDGELETALARYADALALAHAVGELWARCWALDGIAGVACAVEAEELAACLLACSGKLAATAGYRQSPHEHALREGHLETIRAALGERGFASASGSGETMSAGDAVASALAFAASRPLG